MKTSQMIFLGLALFLAVQSSAGYPSSNCGLGSGSDACGCSEVVVKAAKPIRPVKYADPFVIKEAASQRITPVSGGCGSLNPSRKIYGPSVSDLIRHTGGPIAPRFRPVGDLCTCSKTIAEVVPAYPGKPVCNSCAEKRRLCESGFADPIIYSRSSNSNNGGFSSLSSTNAELNAFEDECLSFDEQENIYNAQPTVQAAPADPVSLSLAYGLARQTIRTIPEGSLAFGPKSTPIDGSVRKTTPNIPEERLLTVERPVVELRLAPKSSASATYQEVIAQQEALEQQRLELEAQAEENQEGPSFISYSDLGYAPVLSTGNNFISTISSAGPAAADQADDDSACGPVGRTIPGYVSGNVIIRREEAPENDNGDYYSEGSYEQDSSIEYEDQYGSDSSEESESCDGNSGFLARLRASARSQSGMGCGRGRGRGHAQGCGCGCGQ